ncbi:hypothetical protein [Nitratireductor sp. XY-223]|uniref:hypothetical protein n=1 Tax=Nitratireductor sp. XY-223 TaxID=2561926 RepID=UPI0010AAA7CD|nr:hypothetical protein [Nitratireductor sp. XY-223]
MSDGGGGAAQQDSDPLKTLYQRAEKEALTAELKGSQSVGALISLLRRRARRAALTSRIVLFFLLLTVIAGLFFYLALPFFNQYLDGRRLTLLDTKQALEISDEHLDDRRSELWNRLIEVLRLETNESLKGDWSDSVNFRGIEQVVDGVFLVRGNQGSLVRFDAATSKAESLDGNWSDSANFRGVEQVGDGVFLIHGNEGSLVRYDAATNKAEPLKGDWYDSVDFQGIEQVGDGVFLVHGNQGSLVRFDAATSKANSLEGDWSDSVNFRGLEQVGDGVFLVHGNQGSLVRFDVATSKANSLEGDWSDSVNFRGLEQVGDGVFLVHGSEGSLIRYDAATNNTEPLEGDWPDSVVFQGITQVGDGVFLIHGGEGSLVRYDTATNRAESLNGDWSDSAAFLGIEQVGDGVFLVHGTEGSLVRYNVSANKAASLRGDWSDRIIFLGIDQVADGVFLIHGYELSSRGDGTLVRYDARANKIWSLKGGWSDSVFFHGVEPVGDDRFLIHGSEGTLVEFPSPYFEKYESRELSDEDKILEAMDDLPKSVRDLLIARDFGEQFSQIAGERRPISLQLDQVNDDISGLWTGLFPLNQQRERFEQFMHVCRGGKADANDLPEDGTSEETDKTVPANTVNGSVTMASGRSTSEQNPDAVTLACTQAWRAELEREEGKWWQTLATQVPPGILLLFLLATLAGLYRYNLRLAGFHNSRADVLELISLGGGGVSVDDLTRLSDSLAADKVEFGRANTPTDQAIELVRAVLARKG